MSRKHITDYKKGEVVDTSTLLPEYSRSRLWDGISKNILNRFLTKKNFEEVTGYVGKEATNTVLSRISEDSEFLQKNQLQEVISTSVGSETKFMTFEKFLEKLERDGVDISRFNEWGETLQFNFYPPINIDKIINYQDYYWTNRETSPNYITVEKQSTRSNAKYDELKRGIFSDITETGPSTEINMAPDGMFIVHDVEENRYVPVVKVGGVIESLDDWTLNLTSFNEYVKLDRGIASLVGNELRVDGQFLTGAAEGFILSLYTTLGGSQEFVTVSSYEIDENNNQTIFTLNETPITSPTKVSVHPYTLAARNEALYFNDILEPLPIDELSVYDAGEPVWYTRRLEVSSTTGTVTTLGSNVLDESVESFATLIPSGVDYGVRILTGPNKGDYDVESFTMGTLTVSGQEFFVDSQIEYSIYVKDELTQNVVPQEADFWFDQNSNTLKQFISGTWVDKIYFFSILYDSENSKLRADSNDWAEENVWVHKNQLTSLSGNRQAVQPIIEYKNYIELSSFSRFVFEWAYRSSSTENYENVSSEPNLLEIKPLEIPDTESPTFFVGFPSDKIIHVPEEYGNLATVIYPGDKINLEGFNNNDGQYTVDSVEFVQVSFGERYQTVITVVESLTVITNSDGGGTIYPDVTSLGDSYDSTANHWAFVGIRSITASGAEPEVNPMLGLGSEFSTNITNTVGEQYQTKIGLNWQEFNPLNTYSGAIIELDPSLHDLSLFEDYQEGDLRVYIDNRRVYGDFLDLSNSIGEFVTGVQFDSDIEITPENKIRVELGEYWVEDIGRRDVTVIDKSGNIDSYNLSRYKKIEQVKTLANQYPLFKLYDIFGTPIEDANPIFWFKENSEFGINRTLDARVEFKRNTRDLVFEHGLVDDQGRLRCYLDLRDGQIKTIWKRGEMYELSVPSKVGDDWDITNNWRYNIQHELRKEVSLTDLFRHFKTMTIAQEPTKYNSSLPEEIFHALDHPNLGLGGTIKEHNGNLDLITSAMFSDQVDLPKTMRFVGDAYERIIYSWVIRYLENMSTFLDLSEVDLIENFEDYTENNTRLDRLFGDSFSFADGYGIKNVISTAAMLRMLELTKPAIFKVENTWIVKRHDGSYHTVEISNAQKSKFFRALTNNTQKVTEDSDAFPNVGDYSSGDYLVRGVSSQKTITLYQLSGGLWLEVDVVGKISNLLYEFEELLYAAGQRQEPLEEFYNIQLTTTDEGFNALEEAEFIIHVGEDSLINNTFDSGNAFTWNYASSDVQEHPLSGVFSANDRGSWEALYESVYGTAYPHREPWALQGYNDEPEWWRAIYINTDSAINRFWNEVMWDNIFNGVVPLGRELPDGTLSTGNIGEISETYDYSPVNITSSVVAGIGADELAPPYWDGSLSGDSRFKPLFDRSLGNYVVSPNANFVYGQDGTSEWEWKNSTAYRYFVLKAAYLLDPIEFFSRNYGDDLISVDCLLVNKATENINPHSNTVFHGDYNEDGSVYLSSGIQQWIVNHNRFLELDGGSSEYRELWTNWDINASYIFNSLVNDTTLRVSGDSIDIVSSDYNTTIDRELRSSENTFSAINWAVERKASIIDRFNYETSNWVFRPYIQSPKTEKKIEYYSPQNYKVRTLGSTAFTTGGYNLDAAEVRRPRGTWRGIYSSPLSMNDITDLTGGPYQFTIDIDSTSTTVVQLNGTPSPNTATVEEVIDNINTQLDGASIALENGFLVITSDSTGGGSSISISSDNLFPTIASGFTSETNLSSFEFGKIFYVSGNALGDFVEGDSISVTGSSNYDGPYTVDTIFYDVRNNETLITVLEDVTIADDVVDGILNPENIATIPWETGQEVFLNTDGILPGDFVNYVPYYIIKIDDTTFQLAENASLAEDGLAISFSTSGAGTFWVGKVTNTFKPLTGQIDYAFRRHEPDTRTIKTLYEGQSVTRIQSLVDIVFGYDALLEERGIKSVPYDRSNKAENSGRDNEWILELENYIVWLDTLVQRADETPPRITGTVDTDSSSFINLSGQFSTTGQRVRLKTETGQIPNELDNPFNSFIPYYTIVTMSGAIQLAYSLRDAEAGRYVNFSTGSGEIILEIFKADKILPKKMMNPYYKHFVLSHERGLPSSFERLKNGVFEKQNIYDASGKYIDLENILFFRNDLETSVMLTENSDNQIVSADYSMFEVSHICRFNQYTTGGSLVYDPFLGIKTPRIFLSFLRPTENTGRIHVGGLVLSDESLVDNIEKSVQDIRDYYDIYNNIRGDDTTEAVRRSVGYQGPNAYMEDLGINDKSQFIFWKSFIQSKGTNFSLEAFTNQKVLSGVSVDEFWAYRVGDFGDAKVRAYPEIKLKTDDVVKTELRLEFVPPTGGTVGRNYSPIRLTDASRWENLPDVIELMEPFSGYFLDVEVVEVIENAENELTPASVNLTTNRILRLQHPVYGARITYSIGGTDFVATEGINYDFINGLLIEFTASNIDQWENITVTTLSYAYDSTNIFKLIDNRRVESVVADIPIWNPALGQENPLGNYPIDFKLTGDPATYTDDLNDGRVSEVFWDNKQLGKVWLDTTRKGYVPYYDKFIYSTQEERSLRWGDLAEYGEIEMYRWVESAFSPEEYMEEVSRQEPENILLSEKLTGTPRAVVYKNMGTMDSPIWVEEQTKIKTFPLSGVKSSDTDIFEAGETIDVYENGIYSFTFEFINYPVMLGLLNATWDTGNLQGNSIISLVREEHVPSGDEMDNMEYIIVYPHSKVEHVNRLSGKSQFRYFFWARGEKSDKLLNDSSLTLLDAERELADMTNPYAIIDGFRYEGTGYGVLFGSTYDPEGNDLPLRFSQLIVKGLADTVKNNSDYLLRLRKDFTLRDDLGGDLTKKNKHEDWKLIRKNQTAKIDFVLWKKVVESITGFKVVDDEFTVDETTSVPSPQRVRYDGLVMGAASRIGLGEGQVIVDQVTLRELLVQILFDPRREWSVGDIEVFYETYDLTRTEGYVSMLRNIYTAFTVREVNDIFFEILENSMVARRKHPDFFKTSWVAVDVGNVGTILESEPLEIVSVVPTEMECAVGLPPPPTPTPTPTISVTPSITPTPSVTSSPTPTPTPTPSTSLAPITVEFEWNELNDWEVSFSDG